MASRLSQQFAGLEVPLYCVTFVYLALTATGMFLNSLIVIATVQTKSLHSTCNLLIAICAACDVIHQAGHIPRFYYIYSGVVYTNSWHCQMLEAIPIFGLSAGSFVVLSIGIDRFVATIFPQYYQTKNKIVYLGSHFIGVISFVIWQYYLMFAYTPDAEVICIPPEAFYGEAKLLWSISSCVVYLLAVLIYSVVWFKLQQQENIRQIRKIFRSLFIIMLVVVLGWMLTMSGVFVATMIFHVHGSQMFLVHEVVGVFVNTSLAANYIVYYTTSTEYRHAFQRQLVAVFGPLGIDVESRLRSATVSEIGPTSKLSG